MTTVIILIIVSIIWLVWSYDKMHIGDILHDKDPMNFGCIIMPIFWLGPVALIWFIYMICP